jgi:hypothetical protein
MRERSGEQRLGSGAMFGDYVAGDGLFTKCGLLIVEMLQFVSTGDLSLVQRKLR